MNYDWSSVEKHTLFMTNTQNIPPLISELLRSELTSKRVNSSGLTDPPRVKNRDDASHR